jgi:hypothetical protein
MPNIKLGLEIGAQGATQTVGELKKIRDALLKLEDGARATKSLAIALSKTEKEVEDFAAALGRTSTEILEAVSAMNALKGAGTGSQKSFEILNRTLGVTRDQFEQLDRLEVSLPQAQPGGIDPTGNLAGSLLAAKLAQATTQAGQAALQTGLNFERLKTTLATLLGEQGAAAAFENIQAFAAKTPFQVDQVTQAYISLKQRGIEPTTDTLTKLGDISSSQGKSLQQLVEAVLDASVGENERLKEFGIAASVAGDKVTLSFRGVQKTVAKTPEAITAAITSFGELQGVAGGMEDQSRKLGGQLSNLQDNFDSFSNGLFELVDGPAIEIVTLANQLLSTFFKLPAPMQSILLATGALGGAFIAATAALTAFELASGASIVSIARQSAAQVLSTAKTVVATAVTTANTVATLANATAAGQLTAAQIASAKAFAATAIKAGLFVAAAASIALVADSYRAATAEAEKIRDATKEVDAAIAALNEEKLRSASASEASAASTDIEADALKRTQESVGGIQQALDVVRTAVSKDATAVSISLRQQREAFADLDEKGIKILQSGYGTLQKGSQATAGEIKATTAAIQAQIAALNATQATERTDAESKKNRIEALERLIGKLKKLESAEKDAVASAQKAATQEAERVRAAQALTREKEQEAQADQRQSRQEVQAEKVQSRAERFRAEQEKEAEAFNVRQQELADAFREAQQKETEAFNSRQQANANAFREAQQSAQEVFTQRQQSAQETFEAQRTQRAEATARSFQTASDRASRAEQLAAAQTKEERTAIRAEFARLQQQAAAIRELNLANKDLSSQEIINLAKSVSGATLATQEGAQQVGAAIDAIAAEQQRQQEIADQEAQKAFAQQQQAEAKAFVLQQQAEAKAFSQAQQAETKTFSQAQQAEAKAFSQAEQAEAKAFAQQQQAEQKTFSQSEREIQKAFQSSERALEKQFRDELRAKDKQNAEEIRKILEKGNSANPPTPRALGGSVNRGQTYLVGERGPELFVAGASGQIVSAAQLANLFKPSALPTFSSNSGQKLESQVQELISINRGLNAQILRLASRQPLNQQYNYYGSSNSGSVDLRSENL